MWKLAPSVARKPFVGVVVLAHGEPVPVVLRAVRSVLDRRWPGDRLALVVADQAADTDLRDALAGGPALYHVPEPYEPAGNSALGVLRERFPHMVYVEMRDAGDEPGPPDFLRHCVAQLEKDSWLPFAQGGGSCIVWRDHALEQLGDFPARGQVPAAVPA